MAKKIVVVPGLTPEWMRKRNGIMKAIDERLLLGLERPGAGLTLDQLQKRAVEDRCFCKKKAEAAVLPFKHDKTPNGWTLLEDTPFDGKQFVPDLVEFLKSGESSVNGELMKWRAKELNAHLGQRHAEYLLEHQELITKEWQGKYYLVFPGTVWQESIGLRDIPYLVWSRGEWYLSFRWLEDGWIGYDRLVRHRG